MLRSEITAPHALAQYRTSPSRPVGRSARALCQYQTPRSRPVGRPCHAVSQYRTSQRMPYAMSVPDIA
eukprot:2202962-Rhodomonas_salina.3